MNTQKRPSTKLMRLELNLELHKLQPLFDVIYILQGFLYKHHRLNKNSGRFDWEATELEEIRTDASKAVQSIPAYVEACAT